MRRVDDIVLNEEIVANEQRRPRIVGVNSAHAGGRHDDRLRAFGLKKLANGGLVREIEFMMGPQYQIGVTLQLEGSDNRRTHQSTVARHINSRTLR